MRDRFSDQELGRFENLRGTKSQQEWSRTPSCPEALNSLVEASGDPEIVLAGND
jgi:hypothetical protein